MLELLETRILAIARARVRSGEFTERGLARHLGVSQPHVHNVLSGARPVTPYMLDLLLRCFHLSLLDLFTTDELQQNLRGRDGPAGS